MCILEWLAFYDGTLHCLQCQVFNGLQIHGFFILKPYSTWEHDWSKLCGPVLFFVWVQIIQIFFPYSKHTKLINCITGIIIFCFKNYINYESFLVSYLICMVVIFKQAEVWRPHLLWVKTLSNSLSCFCKSGKKHFCQCLLMAQILDTAKNDRK